MSNNQLTITWKPDVLSMVEHGGCLDNFKGLTARSEVETFRNIKSVDAAKKILLRRNINNIIVAKYNGEVVIVTADKKQRKIFYKKQRRKIKAIAYSNKYLRKPKQLKNAMNYF